MKRVGVFTIATWIVLAIGLAVLGGTQEIKLFGSEPLVIDGSKPCYLAHGWLSLESQIPEGVKPRDYLIEDHGFQLLIDEELMSPTNFVVRKVPESQSEQEEDAWRITWYYRFPPRFFAAGTYTFVGIWYFPGGPPEGMAMSRDVIVEYP